MRLAHMGISPNEVSGASILFAACAAMALLAARASENGAYLVIAAVVIQFRLICNMLDGLIAVEGDRKSKSGELWNDFPDRISDSVLLVSAGYSAAGYAEAAFAGWLSALLAMATAYARVLGASTGAGHCFAGPMAKQHRMALLTAACFIGAVELFTAQTMYSIAVGLWIIVAGAIITIIRRLVIVAKELEK